MKNSSRLKFLRIAVCLGLLVGIVCSHEAWFPVRRAFPRVPFVFALSENFVPVFEWLFSSILIAALILVIFLRRPKTLLLVAVSSLALLIFFDQMRLQPWVYQYALLLVVLASHDWRSDDEAASNQTLGLLQIMIAGLYFWSGAQKLNFTFSHETLPILLAPVQNALTGVRLPMVFLASGIALTEIFIGCGLLVRKTRNLSVCAAIAAHAVILGLLIARNFNSIVWVWNAALMLLVFVSFWRGNVSLTQIFTAWKTENWKAKAAKLLTAASVLLPILSFCGWWDLYLSGALYSGNTATAVVRIDDDVLEKLPPTARQSVFETKSGERILPLFEWSMAELNVPAYPEPRVFKRAARRVCSLAEDKSRVELIIKERPAIFDGSYKVTRITCAELARSVKN